MGSNTKIEWTNSSWTPIRARNLKTGKVGWHCEHATTGCEFCYAEGMNKRLGTGLPFKPGHRKNIEILLDEEMLLAPLRWKRPRMIFVCSMTDAFAEFITDEWLDKMFAVMALCPQHTFQVLTKRAERMRDYLSRPLAHGTAAGETSIYDTINDAAHSIAGRVVFPTLRHGMVPSVGWPLPNVWLGVSCERQEEADERIPHLLHTPAAVRFVSAEPLLGAIDLGNLPSHSGIGRYLDSLNNASCEFSDVPAKLDWIIVGGESGRNARPMHPDWARQIRDDCKAAGVAYFHKQNGEWIETDGLHCKSIDQRSPGTRYWLDQEGTLLKCDQRSSFLRGVYGPSSIVMRVGKKAAGRLLDGVEHNEFPNHTSVPLASRRGEEGTS